MQIERNSKASIGVSDQGMAFAIAVKLPDSAPGRKGGKATQVAVTTVLPRMWICFSIFLNNLSANIASRPQEITLTAKMKDRKFLPDILKIPTFKYLNNKVKNKTS